MCDFFFSHMGLTIPPQSHAFLTPAADHSHTLWVIDIIFEHPLDQKVARIGY